MCELIIVTMFSFITVMSFGYHDLVKKFLVFCSLLLFLRCLSYFNLFYLTDQSASVQSANTLQKYDRR